MNANEYQALAMRSQADQKTILFRLYTHPHAAKLMQLDNASRGLCQDAGEIADIVKKLVEYGQDYDSATRTHLMEEVGDCLWRLAQVCEAAGFSLESCMRANIGKLKVRYPDGYSDYHAAEDNRDRDKEREAVRLGTVRATIPPSQTASEPERTRTRSEVLQARRTVVGCCEQHANNQSCNCLENAKPDLDIPAKAKRLVDYPKCETCGQDCTRLVHDRSLDGSAYEVHAFCTIHDRPALILNNK